MNCIAICHVCNRFLFIALVLCFFLKLYAIFLPSLALSILNYFIFSPLSVSIILFFFLIYLAVPGFVSAQGIFFSCGIWDLFPWPGIKTGLPALGAWSFSHWTTREVPQLHFSPWLSYRLQQTFTTNPSPLSISTI